MKPCKFQLSGLSLLLSCTAPSSFVPGENTSETQASSAQEEGEEGSAESLDEESTDSSQSETDSSDSDADSAGDGSDGSDGTGGSQSDCDIGLVAAPPAELVASWGLSPFYTQHLSYGGMPILSSAQVDPAALVVACDIMQHMLSKHPEILVALIDNHIRVGIMSVNEVTTDIPEHADLYEVYPGTDWDTRARGLGATIERPASTVGEENLLHFAGDPYNGESIMVHEFGHTMWGVGVRYLPDGFERHQVLVAAYQTALENGLWYDSYAATNVNEYWAEAVQSWFNTNLQANPPNGVHNHVNTREELIEYDAGVAAITADIFFDDAWVVP